MPRGGTIGHKGGTGRPKKWKSSEFVSIKIPPQLREDIYKIAIALDHNPDLRDAILKQLP